MVLSGKKKIADIRDINDGRNWCKKKFATNNFPGCTNGVFCPFVRGGM